MPLTEADVTITPGPQHSVLAESPGGPPPWEDRRVHPPASPPPPPPPVDSLPEHCLSIGHGNGESRVELIFTTRDPAWASREAAEARNAEIQRRVDALFLPVCAAFASSPDASQHGTLARRAGEARQAVAAAAEAFRAAERAFNFDPSAQSQGERQQAKTRLELAQELVRQLDRSLNAVLGTAREKHDDRLAEVQGPEVTRLLAVTSQRRQAIVAMLKEQLAAYDLDIETLRRASKPETRQAYLRRAVESLGGAPAEA